MICHQFFDGTKNVIPLDYENVATCYEYFSWPEHLKMGFLLEIASFLGLHTEVKRPLKAPAKEPFEEDEGQSQKSWSTHFSIWFWGTYSENIMVASRGLMSLPLSLFR